GNYIALDMGTWGWSFPQIRSKIMRLWGTGIRNDSRKITGFARDISLISDQEYAGLTMPRAIARFPVDLEDKNLEYSGFYEDGWVAESGYVVLNQLEDGCPLIIRLSVPRLHGSPTAHWAAVSVDGREAARQITVGGDVFFKLESLKVGRHKIELRFDRAANLPAPDNRPISAQIKYIGFQAREAASESARAAGVGR
ncbi:MAG TPA: hypothetical protein VJ732_03425, partial [Bryobacteraceae bacterium]|nr:hypothetical protein [Bryobacteraceae bacterium]